MLHDGALHAPFLTNNPPPLSPRLPPSFSLPFPLFLGRGLGTGPPAGGLELKCIDLSLTGNKLIPPFSLYQKAHRVHECTLSLQARVFRDYFPKRHFYEAFQSA